MKFIIFVYTYIEVHLLPGNSIFRTCARNVRADCRSFYIFFKQRNDCCACDFGILYRCLYYIMCANAFQCATMDYYSNVIS